MGGLDYVLGSDFQSNIAAQSLRWDKEWMRYLSIHRDYNFYFYDMDTPSYALTVGASRIASFTCKETYSVKLFKTQAAQVWAPGSALVGKTVLEMGCGPGMFGRMASRFVGRFIGIDASQFALHIARLTSPKNCEYVHLGDADKISELRGVADTCVGRNFFIHHNSVDSVWILRLLKDVLAPGGIISADFYYNPGRVGEPRRYTAADPLDSEHASALYHFEEEDIMGLARECGLEVASTDKQPHLERHFATFRRIE